jgi:glutamate racemase
MDPSLPIGVFDSGVGGLTVLAALRRALPGEDLIYLGDTARVPYGTRSPETVRRYARRVAGRLYDEGVKALVIACNTATTHALEDLKIAGARAGVPVLGVIQPGVEQALARTDGGVIAVLGTEGTVRGGRYQDALRGRAAGVRALACPLFVPLAEEGWTDGEVARLVAERYLAPLREGPRVDAAILGCTHYPLLKEVIGAALPGVQLVDSADAVAAAAVAMLGDQGLLNPMRHGGRARYLVTDNLERFRDAGRRFLGEDPEPVDLVDLSEHRGLFAEGA